MRVFLFLIAMICLHQTASSQSQQGYVKTLGRPNKPGVPLKDVSIRMRGNMNMVLSSKDGKFSVVMTNKKDGDAFVFLNVRKKGYELVDPDFVGRQQVFSSKVPIEIVMVSSDELTANKQRIEKIAYQKAEENYQKKFKQLEKQLQSQLITTTQYRKQLQDLQDKFEKYQSLISGMADRYARTDYDHLDSIDRVINICIENGELDKADSLIHTVFDPNTVLERNRAAKTEVQAKMQLAQQMIDKACADRNAFRRDSDYAKRVIILCDNLSKEYLSQGEHEKARQCQQQSLLIRQILYGNEGEEVRTVKEEIEKIK